MFSMNDVSEALGAIVDTYDFVDDIVLIDSSDKPKREWLLRRKAALGLSKLRIFHAVALGCVEPLRMYGIRMCRGDWVLYLDADERASPRLKSDMYAIAENARFDALKIKRFEETSSSGAKSRFFTWQIRFYRKAKVTYRGILHEAPTISGPVAQSQSDDIYLEHMKEMRHARNYGRLNVYLPAPVPLTFAKAFYVNSRMNGPVHTMGELRNMLADAFGMAKARRGEIGKISKIIGKYGIIKYLALDNPRTIERLNRRYSGGPHGIDLLTRLLEEKYRKGTRRGLT